MFKKLLICSSYLYDFAYLFFERFVLILVCCRGWSSLFQRLRRQERCYPRRVMFPDAKAAMNTFGNFTYTYGGLTAGLRFESYQNAILGFPNRFKGSGIGSRYVRYSADNFDITVGNFYEQFGNGLSFRTYWEPNLGIDNAMDGIRIIFKPFKGVALKTIYGQLRFDFDSRIINADGIVRGVDGEVSLNEAFVSLAEKPLKVTLGGSFTSKYQAGQTFERDSTVFTLPNNVGATSGRLGLVYKNLQFTGEYVTKICSPGSSTVAGSQTLFAQCSNNR
jgi:hypothetical protein